MELQNVNYKGSLDERIDLHKLKLLFPGAKLCNYPFQLIIKDVAGTLIIFSSGKYRLMGFKAEDDLEATCVVYKYTKFIDPEYMPSLALQSMTLKAHFGQCINLHKLSEMIESRLELELFPCLTIIKYKPASVNVFATGSIIMCGIKDVEFSNFILTELKPLMALCIIPL